MRELTDEEVRMVRGGDAAATRQPGQNAWGEGAPMTVRQCLSDSWAANGIGVIADFGNCVLYRQHY